MEKKQSQHIWAIANADQDDEIWDYSSETMVDAHDRAKEMSAKTGYSFAVIEYAPAAELAVLHIYVDGLEKELISLRAEVAKLREGLASRDRLIGELLDKDDPWCPGIGLDNCIGTSCWECESKWKDEKRAAWERMKEGENG